MGRTKELLEQLEQIRERRDVYMRSNLELREEINKYKAAIEVWKSRWHILDNDFQDLVDDFHTAENENIKLHIEIESLKGN